MLNEPSDAFVSEGWCVGMRRSVFAVVALLFATVFPRVTYAQIAAPSGLLLFVGIEDPNGTDPTAMGINTTLYEELGGAGIPLAKSDKKYALDAIAQAPALCAAAHATGLFVSAGRYEQTEHETPVPFVGRVIHYSTHVEFRLDEIACDGSVRWSTTTKADVGRSGVMFKPNNVGADVDAAFRAAIGDAVKARTEAKIVEATPPAVPGASGDPSLAAALDPKDTLVLVPIEEPGIADPHAADMTHSLLLTMQKRAMTVKTTDALDHDDVVHDAASLCSANGAKGIVVPHVRVEQSGYSGRSHASFAMTLLSCTGVPIAHGSNDADMPGGAWSNFTASATGVFERAVAPALDALYAAPKPAAAGPTQPVSSSVESASNKT